MEILLFVMIIILKKGNIQAADVFLNCPTSIFNSSVDNFITGRINTSGLANAPCLVQVAKNEFVLRKGTVETKICVQDFSTSTVICNTNYNAQNCKCESSDGTSYNYTLKFVANSVSNVGDIILRSDCIDSNLQYIYQSQPCSVDFATTTVPTTTTKITAPTTGSTRNTTRECENCNCNGTCNCPENCSPCPVWCIIVISVCVPVGGGLIITITVIIIKSKKAKKRGNRPIAAPVQVEMNGTEPTPESEKRRKKKKKKKTFQEDDGESVSREEKSTINDHKAAQKSQNAVNENSHATESDDLRRLPMPKTPHTTSVEGNATIVQTETPRKLPPLHPKQ